MTRWTLVCFPSATESGSETKMARSEHTCNHTPLIQREITYHRVHFRKARCRRGRWLPRRPVRRSNGWRNRRFNNWKCRLCCRRVCWITCRCSCWSTSSRQPSRALQPKKARSDHTCYHAPMVPHNEKSLTAGYHFGGRVVGAGFGFLVDM